MYKPVFKAEIPDGHITAESAVREAFEQLKFFAFVDTVGVVHILTHVQEEQEDRTFTFKAFGRLIHSGSGQGVHPAATAEGAVARALRAGRKVVLCGSMEDLIDLVRDSE